MKIDDRLNRLKEKLVIDWGGVCDVLGIKRSMLHYLRNGERRPSSDLMRKLIEVERSAGIDTPPVPTVGSATRANSQRLKLRETAPESVTKNSATRDIHKRLDDLERKLDELLRRTK